jgi:hypothetical protein
VVYIERKRGVLREQLLVKELDNERLLAESLSTENDLNKVSSEKIGYIILEKIEQAFLQLYYKQNDEVRQYYDFIHKYSYSENIIVEKYNETVIDQRKTHDYFSLFWFHPGVIKSVGEIFNFDFVYLHDDNVWAVTEIEKALKK